MNRRKKRKQPKSYGTKLAWTTVLSLVFGAGLICGQHMLRRQAMPPLVSVSSTTKTGDAPTEKSGASREQEKLTFSFYDKLSKQEAPSDKASPPPTEKTRAHKKDSEKASSRAAKPVSKKKQENIASELEGTVRDAIDALKDSKLSEDVLPARYTLQVGAHPSSEAARRQMDTLRKKGLEPHVVVVEEEASPLHRVRVGKFHSMAEARHFQAELKRGRAIETFVTPL